MMVLGVWPGAVLLSGIAFNPVGFALFAGVTGFAAVLGAG